MREESLKIRPDHADEDRLGRPDPRAMADGTNSSEPRRHGPGYRVGRSPSGRGHPFGEAVIITLMTVQTFRELLNQRPFRPFRLVMSSGQAYEVRHPEMAMLTRTDILVGTDVAEDGVPAEFKICSLLHVTAIEPLNSSSAKEKQTGPA